MPAAKQLWTYNLYLQDLITRLDEMKIQAADNQIKAKEKSKERYDRHVKPLKGIVGNYAWVKVEPRTSKLDSYYKKPLKIKAILGRNNVLLEIPNDKTIRKHTDKLKIVPPNDSESNHRIYIHLSGRQVKQDGDGHQNFHHELLYLISDACCLYLDNNTPHHDSTSKIVSDPI